MIRMIEIYARLMVYRYILHYRTNKLPLTRRYMGPVDVFPDPVSMCRTVPSLDKRRAADVG